MRVSLRMIRVAPAFGHRGPEQSDHDPSKSEYAFGHGGFWTFSTALTLSGTQIRHGDQLVIPDVGAAEALDEGSVPTPVKSRWQPFDESDSRSGRHRRT
jgi:hypothetical protein